MIYDLDMSDGPEGLILLISLPLLVGYAANLWALFQAVKTYSNEDYQRIGKNRSNQIAVHVLGIFVQLIGIVMGLIWLAKRSKELSEAKRARLPQ